jgi:superfamily II DNA helicase RecQ
VASIANNVVCIRSTHLHAHLDENTKKMQLQSWLLSKARVMVAIGVIRCGYNYPSIKIIIHHGSFKSFDVLHQKLGRLACDGQPSISQMICSTKLKVEAMHIDSSFDEPNVWIMDTENYQQHNLHIVVDGQSQLCSLILVNNHATIIYNNHKWCHYNHPCHCHG